MDMSDMIEQVKKTVQKYHMLRQGDGVVVGVSGGPDSICLLHLLNSLKEFYGIRLHAAHLNHLLRGQASDEDAKYVRDFCERLDIPFHLKEVDVKHISKQQGISEELAGRQERYRFFFEIARKVGANKIAVAQNINDQAETMLMRFIRGSGPEGLGGIKPVRGDGVIRPLIEVERKAIEEYCRRYQLNPHIDETNLKPLYTRNKIRLKLIPDILNEYNPGFVTTAAVTADIMREDNDFFESYISNTIEGQLSLEKDKVWLSAAFLLEQHPAIQRRVIRKAIEKIKGDTRNIEYKHVNEILAMVGKQCTGLSMDLPDGLRAEIVYGTLYIHTSPKKEMGKFKYPLYPNTKTFVKQINAIVTTRLINHQALKQIKQNKYMKAFDYNQLNEELYIRNRMPGDRFMPLGMTGTKKLKDFFIDLKIPREERDQIPLIATKNDIVWVVGYRMNEKYQCTEHTKDILIIEISGGIFNDK